MNITMMREEVKSLLGVSNDRMKYLIKINKLNNELEVLGYKLITSYRDGRNTIYELEPIEIDEWLQYQSYRNIKKREEHTEYVENRITKGLSSPRRDFVKNLSIDISETTAKRYDDMLLEDEIMVKDRTVFLLFDPELEEFKEITEEEYKQFWASVSECRYQLSHNQFRYSRNEITEKQYDANKFIFMNALGKEEGSVALKFDTYKEYTNTLNTLEQIKKHRKLRNK